MSVDAYATLVDWKELVAVRDAGKLPELATEFSYPWLAGFKDPEWQESFKAAGTAGDRYDELRAHLSQATRDACDAIFRVFFWNLEGYCRDDLGIPQEEREAYWETFGVVLSPETVRELADHSTAVDFGELREVFAAHAKPDPDWYCGTADEFVIYVSQWLRLVQHAAEHGKGVIVSIA